MTRVAAPQKKLAEPEGSAKFEQGGFTSRRRKGPKTLFPGASPGNSFGTNAAPETHRDAVSRRPQCRGLSGKPPTEIGSGSSAKSAMLWVAGKIRDNKPQRASLACPALH